MLYHMSCRLGHDDITITLRRDGCLLLEDARSYYRAFADRYHGSTRFSGPCRQLRRLLPRKTAAAAWAVGDDDAQLSSS